jgi:hypothetical protein
MAATLDAMVLRYSYGKAPADFNEFQPRFYPITGMTDETGHYDVDLSEIVHRDLMGEIQSVIMTAWEPATTGKISFIFGGSNIWFSVNPYAAGETAKCIFPYLSPPDQYRHKLFSGSIANGTHLAYYPFQLVFTNVPLPPVVGGYATY